MNNETWITIGCVLLTISIGFVSKVIDVKRYIKKHNEVEDYLDKLKKFLADFLTKNLCDQAALEMLVRDAPYIQRTLGVQGIATYKPPMQNYLVQNHPVLINFINLLSSSDPSTIRVFRDEKIATTNILVQYVADCDRLVAKFKRGLWNPITTFFEGVRTVLGIPVYILKSAGLLPAAKYNELGKSRIWRIITGFIGVISFISAVWSILRDWDKLLTTLGIMP